MNKSTVFIYGVLAGFVLSSCIYFFLLSPNLNQKVDSMYQNKIDSLESFSNKENELYLLKLNNLNKSIDSLNNIKTKTNNKYETTIKAFSDITVVSNDSITRYISKKIHNK